MKFFKKLLFIAIGFYLFSKVSGYLSILAIYVISYIAASKNSSLQSKVEAHQVEIINKFENFLTSLLNAIDPGTVLIFIGALVFTLSGLRALRSVIREWKSALIIKQQQVRN